MKGKPTFFKYSAILVGACIIVSCSNGKEKNEEPPAQPEYNVMDTILVKSGLLSDEFSSSSNHFLLLLEGGYVDEGVSVYATSAGVIVQASLIVRDRDIHSIDTSNFDQVNDFEVINQNTGERVVLVSYSWITTNLSSSIFDSIWHIMDQSGISEIPQDSVIYHHDPKVGRFGHWLQMRIHYSRGQNQNFNLHVEDMKGYTDALIHFKKQVFELLVGDWPFQ